VPPPTSSAARAGGAAPGRRRGPARYRALKGVTFLLALLPLAKIPWDGIQGKLGANPIEAIQGRLGFWTLTFLTLSLVPTPAHDLLGVAWPVRLRRMLGLFAFAYASLHLVWYVAIDQTMDLRLLVEDVTRRKFMTVGFTAWLLLLPLALTSTDRWVRRLGFVRWKRLHRLVYAAALLGVVHFVWRVKADLRRPIWFAVAVGALLALRLVPVLRRRRAGASPSAIARRPATEAPGPGS
jgi:methionine sulfoxide reductase heme-binding subunit